MEGTLQISLSDRLRVAGRAWCGFFKSRTPQGHARRLCRSFLDGQWAGIGVRHESGL
jgi:hypothetical protein